MQVQVNGDLDRALRDLKKAIARDGILKSLKERDAFGHKRSVMRKAKASKAERRRIKMDGKRRHFNNV